MAGDSGRGGSSRSGDDSPIILDDSGHKGLKTKGLIDTVSEIEHFGAIESEGGNIPAALWTQRYNWDFMEAGFISAMHSALLSVVMTPLAMGVVEKIIPVFGSTNPSFTDQLFAFMLALSLTIGYAGFVANVGKYYPYKFTKRMIKAFVQGLAAGKFIVVGLAFIFFHILYFWVSERNVAKVLMLLQNNYFKVETETLNSIFEWFMEFRKVFLVSAWFLVGTAILFVLIPVISIWWAQHKATKKKKEDE